MNNKLSLLVNFVGVDKMSGALRNIIGLGGKGSKSLRELAGEAKNLQREIADYDRRIQRTSGSATALWDAQKRKMQELEEVQRRINRQQRLAAIEADRQAMQRRGSELKAKGQENVVGGAAAAAPLIYAVKAAADFSSGMVDIQQKAELTNAETDRMANTIVRLADAAKQLPEDMRGAVDVLSGFGLDPRKAVAMIGPIGRLGTAFKVDLSDGASAAYANLNNLKVPIEQTGRALDVMAAAGNAGAFEVKDMAKWFPGLTAQMQALGQRGVPAVADLSAALQIARRGAGDADTAANNVQNLLSKINSPATVRAFKKNFGVDLPTALKKAYAQGKTPLEAIAELTKKATGGDLTKIGYVFEDMQAQSALRQLIQDLDDFRKMRAEIGKASGTIDRAFEQRAARDATVNWRAFLGTASRLAIVLGTTLLPAMTLVLDRVGGAATLVANWAQANPGLATTLTQAATALLAFKIGLGVAQFAIGTILGPIGTFIAISKRLGEGLQLMRIGFALTGRAATLLLANPIGLAVAAVAAAAFGIYHYWGPISGFFKRNWTTIRNVMLGAMVIFTPWLAASVYAASVIYRNWDGIKAATWRMVSSVAGVVGPFMRPFITIGRLLLGVQMQFYQIGINIVGGLIKGIVSMTGAVIQAIINLAAGVGGKFAELLGIKSPSRVFMELGRHVAGGLEAGIDGNRHGPAGAARRMAGGVMAAGALSLTPFTAAARPAAAPAGTAAQAGDTYHFHINQLPGEDAEAFAKRVQELLDQANDRKRRRGFGDD